MMKLRQSLYLVLCLLVSVCTLSGCIEEYEADIPSDDYDLLVVEGAICSSQLNKFILSLPRTDTFAPVTILGTLEELTVCVRDRINLFNWDEHIEPSTTSKSESSDGMSALNSSIQLDSVRSKKAKREKGNTFIS